LNPQELIKLKKIKHCYSLWKKCSGRDSEHVNEWNT
jgi:hypothetical protein